MLNSRLRSCIGKTPRDFSGTIPPPPGIIARPPVEKSRRFGVKRRHFWRRPGGTQFLPARPYPVMDGFPQQGGLRKLLQMLVRLAGVDEHLGTIRPCLGRKPAGIEPGRPGVAEDIDVLRRVA